MEKIQLYVKNDKGRYVEYKEPQPPFDNVLYRKVVRGKKVTYEPHSMCLDLELEEGVWVVVKHKYSKSYISGRYLNDCFMCMKASDIQKDVSLAKIGGMEKIADVLCRHWNELPTEGMSVHDRCRAIIGLIFKYEDEIRTTSK